MAGRNGEPRSFAAFAPSSIASTSAVAERPPAELEAAISEALKATPSTGAYEVDAAADNGGRVVLTGSVDSAAERSLVEAVVITVTGVGTIEDRLTFIPRESYGGGAEIAAQIEGLLRWDARVNDALVRVCSSSTHSSFRFVLSPIGRARSHPLAR